MLLILIILDKIKQEKFIFLNIFFSFCYEMVRIDNKKQNKIRTHNFTYKNPDRKNHGQKGRKFTISKNGTRWERCKQLLYKHKHYNPKSYASLHITPNPFVTTTNHLKNLIILVSLYMLHWVLFRSNQIEFGSLNSNTFLSAFWELSITYENPCHAQV